MCPPPRLLVLSSQKPHLVRLDGVWQCQWVTPIGTFCGYSLLSPWAAYEAMRRDTRGGRGTWA